MATSSTGSSGSSRGRTVRGPHLVGLIRMPGPFGEEACQHPDLDHRHQVASREAAGVHSQKEREFRRSGRAALLEDVHDERPKDRFARPGVQGVDPGPKRPRQFRERLGAASLLGGSSGSRRARSLHGSLPFDWWGGGTLGVGSRYRIGRRLGSRARILRERFLLSLGRLGGRFTRSFRSLWNGFRRGLRNGFRRGLWNGFRRGIRTWFRKGPLERVSEGPLGTGSGGVFGTGSGGVSGTGSGGVSGMGSGGVFGSGRGVTGTRRRAGPESSCSGGGQRPISSGAAAPRGTGSTRPRWPQRPSPCAPP